MTNEEILQIAMRQSAWDSNCNPEDFKQSSPVVVISKESPRARKYLKLPFQCDLTSYGTNIVASVSEELKEIVEDYINTYPTEHCYETPNLIVLQEKLKPHHMNACFMAEYWLPDLNELQVLDCAYELKVLEAKDFQEYYTEQWSNALCKDRKQLDVLAVGAYDQGKLIGLAGCSADCDDMWQIGVDVLPEYRRQGIASAITSHLAAEILKRDKVPFYCCAWSNVKSARNAIKSGFRPAWVTMTVKPDEVIKRFNQR